MLQQISPTLPIERARQGGRTGQDWVQTSRGRRGADETAKPWNTLLKDLFRLNASSTTPAANACIAGRTCLHCAATHLG
jgi:hypothetical protein